MTTFVTCYIDLDKYEIRPPSRHKSDYLNYIKYTLSISKPLIFFVDEDLIPSLQEIRNSDIQYIPFKLTDSPYYKYFNKLQNNRLKNPIHNDSPQKDTLNYMILQWSKMYFLEYVMRINPFNSEYFGWIDSGIGYLNSHYNIEEKMYKNALIEFADTIPDKGVKLCCMKHITRSEIQDRHFFYSHRRGNICGGIITGPKSQLHSFIQYFNWELDDTLNRELIAMDEMIFAVIACEHSELTDLYYGDYSEILINYNSVYMSWHLVYNSYILSMNEMNIDSCIHIMERCMNTIDRCPVDMRQYLLLYHLNILNHDLYDKNNIDNRNYINNYIKFFLLHLNPDHPLIRTNLDKINELLKKYE